MNLSVSKPYKPLYTSVTPKIRYILCEGGRAGGRSFETTQFTLCDFIRLPYYRGAVMREIKETIKDSVWQDLLDRIDEQNLKDHLRITESPMAVKYNEKTITAKAFKASSKNQTAKNKSLAGLNRILIEEAEEINEDDFNSLDVSLRKKDVHILIILAFNPPVKGHWIINKWFDLLPTEFEGFYNLKLKKEHESDTIHIHSTYKDNFKNLNKTSISLLESFERTKPDYFKQMVLGMVPSLKTGLIFKNWDIISDQEYFDLPYQKRWGMDFGYNDPTTLMEVKANETDIWIHEQLYRQHLDTDMLFELIKDFKNDRIIGDSQAKQTIETLKAKGMWIEPAVKGADSVEAGVKWLMGKKIHITESSKGIQEEMTNYSWLPDKNKFPTDKPEDAYNHAIDACRYATEELQLDQDYSTLYGY